MPQNGIHPRPFIIIKPFHKMDAYGILLLLINCATEWDASETHGDICREPCSDSPKAHQWRTKGAPVRTQKCTSAHQRAPKAHQRAPKAHQRRARGSPASHPRRTSSALSSAFSGPPSVPQRRHKRRLEQCPELRQRRRLNGAGVTEPRLNYA